MKMWRKSLNFAMSVKVAFPLPRLIFPPPKIKSIKKYGNPENLDRKLDLRRRSLK